MYCVAVVGSGGSNYCPPGLCEEYGRSNCTIHNITSGTAVLPGFRLVARVEA